MVGGRLDTGESLHDGLQREVKEESGLEISDSEVLTVHDKFQEIKGEAVHIVRVYYLCRVGDGEVVLSSDHDQYEWINTKDCDRYAILEDVKEVLQSI